MGAACTTAGEVVEFEFTINNGHYDSFPTPAFRSNCSSWLTGKRTITIQSTQRKHTLRGYPNLGGKLVLTPHTTRKNAVQRDNPLMVSMFGLIHSSRHPRATQPGRSTPIIHSFCGWFLNFSGDVCYDITSRVLYDRVSDGERVYEESRNGTTPTSR